MKLKDCFKRQKNYTILLLLRSKTLLSLLCPIPKYKIIDSIRLVNI